MKTVSLLALFAFPTPTWAFQPLQQTRRPRVVSLVRPTPTLALSATATSPASGLRRARDLVKSLVEKEKCYVSESSIQSFVDACAIDVVIEDRFFTGPFLGKRGAEEYMSSRVAQRQGKGIVRIDKISDGDMACGYAWTWECGNEEGLRGTTFVRLNDQGEIAYIAEIPEPIYKFGDSIRVLLEAITEGAEEPVPQPYQARTPTVANELAKYLFIDLQKAGVQDSMDEFMRFIDDDIIYRDFNFEDEMRGPQEVKQFVQDFSFPGIEFRPLEFDDGETSTCFTWEIVLNGAPDTIQGMSFYELDPETRKIVYVRDVPESSIKPPILGTWARNLRPGLGVFSPVPKGSRPGGM